MLPCNLEVDAPFEFVPSYTNQSFNHPVFSSRFICYILLLKALDDLIYSEKKNNLPTLENMKSKSKETKDNTI